MSLGPFDLTGGPFLTLYTTLLAATVVAGLIIPRRLRPLGHRQRVTDVDQLAYLAGGRARFGDALVARRLAAKALLMVGKDRFSIEMRELARSPAERAVVALPSPARWREIDRALKSYAGPLARRMIDAGLLMSDSERGSIRFWVMLPYLMLLTFGATTWVIGDMRERPVGYVTALLIATFLLAVLRWFRLDRRTQAGREALTEARNRSGRLKRAPTEDEIGLAVALFGTGVLLASPWAEFHQLRTHRNGDGGSSGSCGGGGGDGGGCSGGCGGGCGG